MNSNALSKFLAIVLTAALALPFVVPMALAQAPTGLNISVIPLGTGVSVISKTEREFSVQVQDVSIGPIPGAQVTFSIPEGGAGSFADGSNRAVVFTGLQGIAVARGFRLTTSSAPSRIQVEASFKGQTATASLVCCDAEAGRSNGSRWKVILAIAVGAAAGVAIFYATRGTPPAVIVPGTPTVGTPHLVR